MEQATQPGVAGPQKQSGGLPSQRIRASHDGQSSARWKAILIIDHKPALIAMLTDVFGQDDFVVDTAANGVLALEKLGQQSYDVVLCDIRMPRLNGSGFYRTIEQREPTLLSRVLFMTGDILSPETRAFLRQTDAPVLEKRFSLAEICKIVRHILRAYERY